MKAIAATSLRHAFTALAGLGTYLSAHGLIGGADAPAVDAAGASLGDVLAVIAAALVARLAVWLSGKAVTGGSSRVQSLGLAIGLGSLAIGGLSGCSAAQLAALQAIPVNACVLTPNGKVCYSSKAGNEADVDLSAAK